MKNLLINRPIVSLIAPPLKRFLTLFCLVVEDLYNEEQEVVMDPIVLHFEIFARALLDQLDVIVKSHLLQLYILEMFVNLFIL